MTAALHQSELRDRLSRLFSDHQILWWDEIKILLVFVLSLTPPSLQWSSAGGIIFSAAWTEWLVRNYRRMKWENSSNIFNENMIESPQDLRQGRRFTFQQVNEAKHNTGGLRDNSECFWETQTEPWDISGGTWEYLSMDKNVRTSHNPGLRSL